MAWISGTGVVSCVARGSDAFWQKVKAGESGVNFGLGSVSDGDISDLPQDIKKNHALAFALLAAQEAMSEAGWDRLEPGDGLILATTTGQVLLWENFFTARLRGEISADEFQRNFVRQPLEGLKDELAMRLDHRGPSLLISSACSAATQAIGMAHLWIKQGIVRRCLVGGAEVLCDLTIEGFRSLQLLSTEPSRPFDLNRKGINLSEGAGFLCLEAEARNSIVKISGFGMSSDGHHMTGPHPEGLGSQRAMLLAFKSANLAPADISWVHAHGTGSAQNDLSEGSSLEKIFDQGKKPWVSSTKGVHGHSLGASGAIEAVLVTHAIKNGLAPGTRGLVEQDPQIRIPILRENLRTPIRHVLKNTLGFGGNNAALIFSHVEALHGS